MTHAVAFTVNGKPLVVSVADEQTPLLDMLRNELRLTGTRFGCGLEQCGCCIVLIDGKPEKSCTRLIGSVADRDVTTIEGTNAASLPGQASNFAIVEKGTGRILRDGFATSTAAWLHVRAHLVDPAEAHPGRKAIEAPAPAHARSWYPLISIFGSSVPIIA